MTFKVISDKDLRAFEGKIDENLEILALKLVKIGPQTKINCENAPLKICEIVDQQSTFFLIGDSKEELKKQLTEFVDKFWSLQ